MIIPAPGQIWIQIGSYASFLEVTKIYGDGLNTGGKTFVNQQTGKPITDEDIQRKYQIGELHGVNKVEMMPIEEDAASDSYVLSINSFLREFHYVFNLHEWLTNFRSLNPHWEYPQIPDRLRIHQIWEIPDQNKYVRVIKPGLPKGSLMSYKILSSSIETREETMGKLEFQATHRYCFNLIDVLKSVREQITQVQG